MWIETDNSALQALYDQALLGDLCEPPGVEFGDTQRAQVTAEVGERLVEHYDDIRPVEGEEDTDA